MKRPNVPTKTANGKFYAVGLLDNKYTSVEVDGDNTIDAWINACAIFGSGTEGVLRSKGVAKHYENVLNKAEIMYEEGKKLAEDAVKACI